MGFEHTTFITLFCSEWKKESETSTIFQFLMHYEWHHLQQVCIYLGHRSQGNLGNSLWNSLCLIYTVWKGLYKDNHMYQCNSKFSSRISNWKLFPWNSKIVHVITLFWIKYDTVIIHFHTLLVSCFKWACSGWRMSLIVNSRPFELSFLVLVTALLARALVPLIGLLMLELCQNKWDFIMQRFVENSTCMNYMY